MIRVVADTNVYVSAIVFRGTCEAVLALARAGVLDLYVSPAIQRELRFVLAQTFSWTQPGPRRPRRGQLACFPSQTEGRTLGNPRP